MYTRICTSMPAVYVFDAWNTGMSLCVYVYACMYASAYVYTHTYMCICMYVHGPDAGVPEQARFSAMHACMHVRMYVYVYSCRCKYISISKSSNVRNKWLFDKLKPYSHAPRLCVHGRTHTAFVHEYMDICRQERGDRLGTYAQYASYIHTCVLRV